LYYLKYYLSIFKSIQLAVRTKFKEQKMKKFGMSKAVLSSLMLALVLTACKSTPMVETPVEDKTAVQTSTSSSASDAGADTSAVKEVAIDSTGMNSVSPLNDPNNILSQRSIYFDYNSDVVKTEFRALLEAHAQYLLANSGAKIRLLGNTDERGTREYNLSLGQRRSVAVKQTMNLLGVSDAQIETVSYGEENANTNCAADDCYKVDRRVDIAYTSEQ
jgi:peptidoglycan-associated lipoprotein